MLDTGHATIENTDRIAEVFVAARRAGTSIADYPGPIPADFATSYAIQEQAIALDGRAIAGWKVGRVHPPQSIEHGTDRLAGPIFDGSVVAASNEAVAMPVGSSPM